MKTLGYAVPLLMTTIALAGSDLPTCGEIDEQFFSSTEVVAGKARIRKWAGPLNIQIRKMRDDWVLDGEFETALRQLWSQFSVLAGVNVDWDKKSNDGNNQSANRIIYHLVESPERLADQRRNDVENTAKSEKILLSGVLLEMRCEIIVRVADDQNLSSITIFMPQLMSLSDQRVQQCLKISYFVALGVLFFNPAYTPNYFTGPYSAYLSKVGQKTISALYDSRMKPGLSYPSFRALATANSDPPICQN